MNQGVDVDLLRLAEVVDFLEQRVELVHRVDAVGLAAGLAPAGAADRRLQGIVRVGVDVDQEELQFRRHHGLPVVLGVERDHPLQHVAGGEGHRAAVEIVGIADHLGGGLRVPGHEPDGLGVWGQIDVRGGRIGDRVLARIVAGHGLHEERLGDPQAVLLHAFDEALGRHDLAAPDARHVRHQAFDFFDLAVFQELLDRAHGRLSRWGSTRARRGRT